MDNPLRNIAKRLLVPLAEKAAHSYVAGPELEDALRVCRQFSENHIGSSVCYWNELEAHPRQVADNYVQAVDALASESLDCYISIKAPPLKFDSDLLTEIVDHSQARNVCVHFDSIREEDTDKTFSLIDTMLPRYRNLGCTLPGRWQRSLKDADWATQRHLHIRVVKGQWPDSAQSEGDLRTGFLEVIDRLAGRGCRVGVATHDPLLAREALTRLAKSGTPCELELLFGLPARSVLYVGSDLGVPVRFYVPYGKAWLPYALSQMSRNPRLFWWFVRDLFADRTPVRIKRHKASAEMAHDSRRA